MPDGGVHPNAPHQLRTAAKLRSLPYAEEAERSVIGAVLLDVTALGKVRPHIKVTDFHHPVHRAIFDAALTLADDGKPIDAVAVADQMRADDTYDRLRNHGGEAFLFEVSQNLITVENIAYHAKLVANTARRRRLIEFHTNGRQAAEDLNNSVDEVLRTDQVALGELDLRASDRQAAPPLVAVSVREDWCRPLPAAIPTGLRQLDQAVGGFRAEATYVLNGGTGAGKSGLALQLSDNVEVIRSVAYFSTELSRRQVSARLIAMRLQRRWAEIYNLGPSETDSLVEAIANQRIRIIEVGRRLVVPEVLDAIAQVDGEPPLLIFDYLQGYARRRTDSNDLRGAVASLSDELNTWARETRSTALVLSSVARHLYSAKDNEQKAATDFAGAGKDAGEIEFDARCVMFLETQTCPLDGEAPAKLHVAKSTFGGAGTIVGLRFRGAYGVFVEDNSASLTDFDHQVLKAIRDGATSTNEVIEKIKRGRARTLNAIRKLVETGILRRQLGDLVINEQEPAK